MRQPAAAPPHRVPRSPLDDRFVKGRPTPASRLGAGEVTALDDADSVTVDMNEELVSGVFVQGNMPTVGDQIEVWSAGDVLYSPGIDDVIDAGLIRVNHGIDATVARPNAPVVLWVGSVTPSNADQDVDLIVWVG